MADRSKRAGNNARGRFYVYLGCVGCGVCLETAPANFRADAFDGLSFVCKQPESDRERNQCQDAMKSCPADMIGNDGEVPWQEPPGIPPWIREILQST